MARYFVEHCTPDLGSVWFGISKCVTYFLTHRLDLSSAVLHLREHGSYNNWHQDLQLVQYLLHVRPQQQTNYKTYVMAVLCPYVLSALLRPRCTQSLRLVLTTGYFFPTEKDYAQVIWVRLGSKLLSARHFIPDFKSSCLQSLCPSLFCLHASTTPSPSRILQQNSYLFFGFDLSWGERW